MTGATGLVGRALVKTLIDEGYTVRGVARKRPTWWRQDMPFLALDLLRDDPRALEPIMEGAQWFLHVCDLGKADPCRNKRVAKACYTLCRDAGVRSFFYFSSIRVYGAVLGEIDEAVLPRPFASDRYGVCKLEIESLLSELHEQGGPRLVILRLGNVFSDETPHKFPEPANAVTRFRYRGMNLHLIGAPNVAYAVLQLLSRAPEVPGGVFNITQECEGQNDAFYLADRLNGVECVASSVPSSIGRKLRAWLSNRSGEGPAGYFTTVKEQRLKQLNIHYPQTLLEQLLTAKCSSKMC